MQMPSAHKASLFLSLSLSFSFSLFSWCCSTLRCSNFSSLRPRVASIPARRSFPLLTLLLARRNVCIARSAEWPGWGPTRMSVSWISFVATRRRVYIFALGTSAIRLDFYRWKGIFLFHSFSAKSSLAAYQPERRDSRERKREIIGHDFSAGCLGCA